MLKRMQATVSLVSLLVVAAPLATAVHAATLADLVPTRIVAKTVGQVAPCEASLQATIRDVGGVDTGAYAIGFIVKNSSGTVVAQATADVPNGTNVKGVSTKSATIRGLAAGTYTVTVTADVNNQVAESNEANNTLTSKAFTCR